MHEALDRRPLLIGMVHLAPLPGAPGWDGGRAWLARARAEARLLAEAGFDAVLVENFGDAPFYKDRVPPVTVAALGVAGRAVREAVPARVAVGVNVLRNDARAALGVAAAAGLDFVRVNVLTGAVLTDQGIVEGRAAEVARLREAIAPDVRIFADVLVKHAAPLAPRPLEEEVHDTLARGGADSIIVSGSRTGAQVDAGTLAAVKAAAPETRILIGSGARIRTAQALLAEADGLIVGTALKRDDRIDPERAAAFVRAARGEPPGAG